MDDLKQSGRITARRFMRRLIRRLGALPVRNGRPAIALLLLAAFAAGLESALVQGHTAYQGLRPELLRTPSSLLLLCLDFAVPLTVALLSRRVFMAFLALQTALSVILLHYTIFFYNPLTLSTIYHSLQGAASLGIDIFGFARWDIILGLGAALGAKLFLVHLSRAPDRRMPRIWNLRGIVAVACMALICGISLVIYGRTGLSLIWVDSRGHRTATERRLEAGTGDAVRNIGFVATWIGEWMSGTYTDTELIYAEMRCPDPDRLDRQPDADASRWHGLPVPGLGPAVALIQVESLDFAVLDMRVGGSEVTPFLNRLINDSLVLKTFAPHKVGSSNSDYELLNGRVADQNVIYYSYIKEYPDSIVHALAGKGYAPAVFHGLAGTLFNLRAAYAAQGFTAFTFKEELLAQGYRPGPYIMEHIMDEDLFAAAIAAMNGPLPFAQFLITMSSHIPFMDSRPPFRSAGGVFARYVSSLNYTDGQLAAYYEALPQGSLLLIWGDHGSDVDYPAAYKANERHVPFIVHIKGDTAWLADTPRSNADAVVAASSRIYRLCELGHYVRRMVR
jgi:hypothetical protein